MTATRTASDIAADLQASIAGHPTVCAKSMLAAQAYRATTAERATLVRTADLLRELLNTTDRQKVNVAVVDVYSPTVVIGHLTFAL